MDDNDQILSYQYGKNIYDLISVAFRLPGRRYGSWNKARSSQYEYNNLTTRIKYTGRQYFWKDE